ncbi:MAG: CHAP domain-containing protein [Candidatus Lokiarchaeota archaeon]|nr:CHAP domain-containing protein [Candidatus Lokiarchaeota archaeon]
MNLFKRIFLKFKNSKFFRQYKEELIIIPILLLIFWGFNHIAIALYPEGAFFDYVSEIETILSKIVIFIIALWTAHLALRMSFPKVYKYLQDDFYFKFNDLDNDKKSNYAIKFILVFILAAALVFSAKAQSTNLPYQTEYNWYNLPWDNIKTDTLIVDTFSYRDTIQELEELTKIDSNTTNLDIIRLELVDTITKQLTVRETNPNRGYMVDIYNREIGVVLGSPWCGSFIGSNLTWQGVDNPHSARAKDYALEKDIIWKAKIKNNPKLEAGDVLTWYYSNLGRVGHAGFYIETDKNNYFITIEGNTNGNGSREGDGVYKKKRSASKVYAGSRYIK